MTEHISMNDEVQRHSQAPSAPRILMPIMEDNVQVIIMAQIIKIIELQIILSILECSNNHFILIGYFSGIRSSVEGF